MSSFFNVWLPKGDKNVRENKGHWPFNSPGSHFSLIERPFHNAGQMHQQGFSSHCLHFSDQRQLSVIEAHTHDIQREGPLCPPWVGDGRE